MCTRFYQYISDSKWTKIIIDIYWLQETNDISTCRPLPSLKQLCIILLFGAHLGVLNENFFDMSGQVISTCTSLTFSFRHNQLYFYPANYYILPIGTVLLINCQKHLVSTAESDYKSIHPGRAFFTRAL